MMMMVMMVMMMMMMMKTQPVYAKIYLKAVESIQDLSAILMFIQHVQYMILNYTFVHVNMSHLVEKPTMWFPNRSDTNRPVQLQK